jgi:hypothetical protein
MDWGFCPYCGTVADNRKAAVATSLEPTTLKEIEQAKEVEAVRQSIAQKSHLHRSQDASSLFSANINGYGIDKITQARQSAMSMLKQAFSAPSLQARPNAESESDEVVSLDRPSESKAAPATDSPQSIEEEKASSVKKRTTSKKRTTKRTKK